MFGKPKATKREMEKFQLIYFSFGTDGFEQIIQHCVNIREDKKLKTKISTMCDFTRTTKTHSRDFRVIPKDIKPFTISANNELRNIEISKPETISPAKKISKTPTSIKYVHQSRDKQNEAERQTENEVDKAGLGNMCKYMSLLDISTGTHSRQTSVVKMVDLDQTSSLLWIYSICKVVK